MNPKKSNEITESEWRQALGINNMPEPGFFTSQQIAEVLGMTARTVLYRLRTCMDAVEVKKFQIDCNGRKLLVPHYKVKPHVLGNRH